MQAPYDQWSLPVLFNDKEYIACAHKIFAEWMNRDCPWMTYSKEDIIGSTCCGLKNLKESDELGFEKDEPISPGPHHQAKWWAPLGSKFKF